MHEPDHARVELAIVHGSQIWEVVLIPGQVVRVTSVSPHENWTLSDPDDSSSGNLQYYKHKLRRILHIIGKETLLTRSHWGRPYGRIQYWDPEPRCSRIRHFAAHRSRNPRRKRNVDCSKRCGLGPGDLLHEARSIGGQAGERGDDEDATKLERHV